MDSVTAAQQAFGDLNKLQKNLNSYIRQQSLKLFVLRQSFKVDESSFQVRQIPSPEVDAIRADVLIGNDRARDAQPLLDSVLRDDPKDALAHEAMGFLKFREGEMNAAKDWYSQAIQLDSHSFLTYYYFAVLSLQARDTGKDDAIESALRMSIKLEPSFAPSYDALAMFYAQHHHSLEEAHLLSLKSVELEPEVLAYRLDGAQILAEGRQFPSAISVLKNALPLARSPLEVAMVEGRIHSLQEVQKNNEIAASSSTLPQKDAPANSPEPPAVIRHEGRPQPIVGLQRRYPTEPPTGAQHIARGVLRTVACSYPTILTLTVDQTPKQVSLYSNYYKVTFTIIDDPNPGADLDPCKDIDGKRATVRYAEVSDKSIDGQILTIELTK